MTHGGGWLTLTGMPVSQVNELLDASYQLYRHVGMEDSTILRTVGYSLPEVLHAHVEAVAPTTFFSTSTSWQTQRERSFSTTEAQGNVEPRELVTKLSSRQDLVVPEFLRWLYKTYGYVPAATDKNVLGIVGYNNEFPSPTDLSLFMAIFRKEAVRANFIVEPINGGPDKYDTNLPSGEANLNMQYAQAIAFPTPHVFYSIGGKYEWHDNGKPIAGKDSESTWLKYLLGKDKIPQTISISYGVNETVIPREYAKVICNLFKQLGARGVSILAASGDDGVGYGHCNSSGQVQFQPLFPASCTSDGLSVLPKGAPC